MSQIFEEIASEELDALYRGALFLSAGDRRDAEHLLVDAVSLAFSDHPTYRSAEDTGLWFEARLVRAFLRRVREGPAGPPAATFDRSAHASEKFDGLGPDDLFEAASMVPAWPRAALWLVVFRRWSYEQAAHILQVDDGQLRTLLTYQDTLMQALLTRTRWARGRRTARS